MDETVVVECTPEQKAEFEKEIVPFPQKELIAGWRRSPKRKERFW
jgi:hypothetical protein